MHLIARERLGLTTSHAAPCLAAVAAYAGAGLFALALGLASSSAFAQEVPSKASTPPPAQAAAPYALPFAESFDLTAKNGRVYRIMVAQPFPGAAGPGPTPVVYVLDGNASFAMATEIARLMSLGRDVPPVYVVGIGYPTNEWREWFTRRRYDLTPTAGAEAAAQTPGAAKEELAGSAEFLDFLTNQVMPTIQRRYPVDAHRSVLAGLSFGGLFGAYALFHGPEAFSGYLIMSPSLWWDKELAFSWEQANAKAGRPLRGRVYLSVGAKEETSGEAAMVSNVRRLSDALSARPGDQLAIKSDVIEGETHYSNFGAAFTRGLRFVLAPAASAATNAH